jgi:hypothetical protein
MQQYVVVGSVSFHFSFDPFPHPASVKLRVSNYTCSTPPPTFAFYCLCVPWSSGIRCSGFFRYCDYHSILPWNISSPWSWRPGWLSPYSNILRAERPGFGSRQGKTRLWVLTVSTQWVPETLSLEVKRPGCEAHHPPLSPYVLMAYKQRNSVAWLRSTNEPYRPNDRLLSSKLVPTFADIRCHVVSVTDPYNRTLCFLHRSRYFFFQAAQLYSRGWVDPVPDLLLLRKSGSAGNPTRTSRSVARNSDR